MNDAPPLDYLLVYAHIQREKDVSVTHGDFVPYGLCILDEVLKEAGFKGRALLSPADYAGFMNPASKPAGKVRLIGVSSSTLTRFDAIEKIRQCRALFPNSLIVAGGCHFGGCADDSIQNIPELDIVVRGEGDEVILDLMEHALGRKKREDIQGITFRDAGGRPVSQGARLIVDRLPPLRFMNRLYSMDDFRHNLLHPNMPLPSMNIMAGRGCPFGCIFCSVNHIRNRIYAAGEVVDIIEQITRQYGIQGVKFQDDALTLNKAYVIAVCEEIIRRKLEIYWLCDSRANIDLDLLNLMHRAGCRFISVGLETGSPKIQKIIGKNITNEQLFAFAQRCRQVGITAYVFLMASFPDETAEDLALTVAAARDLCQKYGALAGSAGIAAIVPGAQLEAIARERGILPRDFSWAAPYYEPRNIPFGASPLVPIYLEHITLEMFQAANNSMVANYAAGMPPAVFVKEAFENLLRNDRTWGEKFRLGLIVLSKLWERLLRRVSPPRSQDRP